MPPAHQPPRRTAIFTLLAVLQFALAVALFASGVVLCVRLAHIDSSVRLASWPLGVLGLLAFVSAWLHVLCGTGLLKLKQQSRSIIRRRSPVQKDGYVFQFFAPETVDVAKARREGASLERLEKYAFLALPTGRGGVRMFCVDGSGLMRASIARKKPPSVLPGACPEEWMIVRRVTTEP